MKNSLAKQLDLSLFGASPDTSNQGVNALHDAILCSLAKRGVRSTTVFGYSESPRRLLSVEDRDMWVEQVAAYRSRRLYRQESFFRLRVAARLGVSSHLGASKLLASKALLDISAGDSFTDLYGWRRFLSVLEPKLMASGLEIPLVLLPQTIGPFQSPRSAKLARRVLSAASQVWVRDEESLQLALELCDDPSKVRDGVDMAFLLRPVEPMCLPARVRCWLDEAPSRRAPLLGLNVSGLIYNEPATAREEFGLKTDYCGLVPRFLEWCMESTSSRVLLIPHVLAQPGCRESDLAAAQHVLQRLPSAYRSRIEILPADYSASELKWIISHLDWFCGTRMHSTIASLSSSVPTAALAYSMKTHGVFAKCGLGSEVLELRELPAVEAMERLKVSVQSSKRNLHKLRKSLPSVLDRANAQMDEIVDFIAQLPERGGKFRPKPFSIAGSRFEPVGGGL